MRCRNMRAVGQPFHTGILDFERVDGDDDPDDCAFIMLARGGDRLALVSDDGESERWSLVMTDDSLRLAVSTVRERGVQTPRGSGRAEGASMTDRSIRRGGTREFYVRTPTAIPSVHGSRAGALGRALLRQHFAP